MRKRFGLSLYCSGQNFYELICILDNTVNIMWLLSLLVCFVFPVVYLCIVIHFVCLCWSLLLPYFLSREFTTRPLCSRYITLADPCRNFFYVYVFAQFYLNIVLCCSLQTKRFHYIVFKNNFHFFAVLYMFHKSSESL